MASEIVPYKKERWDCTQVGLWLKSIGLEHHIASFAENGIKGRHLELLEELNLKELGMVRMADRLTFKTELNRSSTHGLASLPPSLRKTLMMEAIEEAMQLVPEIPPDFKLDDHCVYKDVYNREIIVPAYLTIGLRLKTEGLPRIASEFITENIKFSVNQQVHDRKSRALSMEVENSTNQVSIAGNFNTTGDDALMMFAGESEMSFEMWRAFPFDRPTVILRFEILPIHLPHPIRDRPWVVYFQMHEAEHPAAMVSFSYGSDQMPSFNVAQSKTEVHLLPSTPAEAVPVEVEQYMEGIDDIDEGCGGSISSSEHNRVSSPFNRPYSTDRVSEPLKFKNSVARAAPSFSQAPGNKLLTRQQQQERRRASEQSAFTKNASSPQSNPLTRSVPAKRASTPLSSSSTHRRKSWIAAGGAGDFLSSNGSYDTQPWRVTGSQHNFVLTAYADLNLDGDDALASFDNKMAVEQASMIELKELEKEKSISNNVRFDMSTENRTEQNSNKNPEGEKDESEESEDRILSLKDRKLKSSFFAEGSQGEVDDALDPLEYNEPAYKRAHAKSANPGVMLTSDVLESQGHVHTPVLRIKIHLYREPNAMIFNGFFPMIIVNCGTILVAIPQDLDASNFTQTLENSLTVMLALFAFLIFLRERLPPIPEATWVDNTVCTSVVMILLAMMGATASWCLGNHGPTDYEFSKSSHGVLARQILTSGCFFCIVLLQLMLLTSVTIQWMLYQQRIEEDHDLSCRIRALVERKFKADKWQQRKRLPPLNDYMHKSSSFASKFLSHDHQAVVSFFTRCDWLYLGDAYKLDFSHCCWSLFKTQKSVKMKQEKAFKSLQSMYDDQNL